MNINSNEPVPKYVLKNTIPAILGMIMVLIYNMADLFFVGQTGDALQVTSVSLATPVFLVFISIGTIFGMGGASVISRALGADNKVYANKVASFAFGASVIVGIFVSILLCVFADDIAVKLGAASDTTVQMVSQYIFILAMSGPFIILQTCFSNILRAEGNVQKAMMGMLIGNIVNIVLDPIFILVLGMNVPGAAIATTIGNICSGLYYILFFVKRKSKLSISLKDFTVKEKVCRNVLAIGIPASLGIIFTTVSQIVINLLMSDYGELAVAGVGVSLKIILISWMLCVGLGQGVQPILGFCVGAKDWDRFLDILKFSLLFGLALGVVMTGFCYVGLTQIVGAFLADEEAFAYAYYFSQILLSTGCLLGVFNVLTNALGAMGAEKSSLVANACRQGIIFLPLILIMNYTMGIDGLLWAQPISDVLTLILTIILCMNIYKILRSKDKVVEKHHTNELGEQNVQSI
ncbi:MATE family efflux transporter [Tannockella kyphosi]|uniref:MATE family efflux transporter n=1 Tax=Tannockella kyphosi TaxID=2899121 RepID=UPI0020120037|nr:MATE family efflux transporter [Tannockella kyphosi]